ncbi:Dienelactone hydrolase-like enzyme [Bradyrhizobium vignae]|uniref:Dienelactone hydrolase-like enzyme n=2 Tax=Bradyrhizobium vignae TaxID=1549949 RepID=A0A2U3PV81_9BRAD|nr:Dienelactone hydrolase-like enzyme [Bradyrhizobium vignae]
MIAECMSTIGSISEASDDSWYDAWTATAKINRVRGNLAIRDGNIATAQSNWLRAINYHRTATQPLLPEDERWQASVRSMRACASDFLRHHSPVGEIVSIPWICDYPLQGYFLRSNSPHRAPTVICMGEPGRAKEDGLSRFVRQGVERGLSLLLVDLLGDTAGFRLGEIIARPDLETAVSSVMDYLSERDDVDEQRIGVLSDACSSSFVARAVASDGRFAAAACDGGIWDIHETQFLAARRFANQPPSLPLEVSRIARGIRCPLLITLGELGWLKVNRVAEIVHGLSADARRDITLRYFTASETAAWQGHADNPTLANEYIFDWLASKLRVGKRASKSRKC